MFDSTDIGPFVLAVCVVLAGVAPVATTAAADTADGESVLDSVLNDDDDGGVIASLRGLRGGVTGWINRILSTGSPDETAETAATNAADEFNAHNATIESYVNNRTTASTDADVLEVTFRIDGDEATRYLTATVENETYTNATVVVSTPRTIDESCALEDDAAANLDTEIERFVDTFASTGENVSSQYRSRITSQYVGDVSCSFLPGGS